MRERLPLGHLPRGPVRAVTRAGRLVALAAGASLAQGCFLFNTADEDAGPDAATDAGWRDGEAADGAADAGPFDAGECWLGTTRLCDPYCSLRCPPEAPSCSDDHYSICASPSTTDPRSHEQCNISLEFGSDYCYSGAVCALYEAHHLPGDPAWNGGGCVDPTYCRWVLDQPELAQVRCRYSEGTLFVEGPPDHACPSGSDPGAPLCGGRCGDTCPPGFEDGAFGRPACVGLSETRGVGVCVPSPRPRCDASRPDGIVRALNECGYQGGVDCVCMVLSPTELPEFANYGWGVARDSCLAYRERYPAEVRCVDGRGEDL